MFSTKKSGRLLIIIAQGTDNAASLPHLQRAADGGDLDAIVHVGRPYMLLVDCTVGSVGDSITGVT